MRVAIYYTPAPGSPLVERAAEWLGRDAFSDEATRAPDPAIDPLVRDPARYGFHATVKAPFRLADGTDLAALDRALAEFAARHDAGRIARLALRRVDGFFALVPAGPEPILDDAVGQVVRRFDPFRAPPTENEIARRRPDALTERQRRYLQRWGYPYVFEEFRFHMTLTNRVADEAAAEVERRLAERFAAMLDQPLAIDALALFVEPQAGGPFTVHARHTLRA